MSAINEDYSKGAVVDSQLGKRKVDSEGSPVAGSRMDVSKAYAEVPGMNRGKGMWPSWQMAANMQLITNIYGSHSPESVCLESLYGAAFQYADKTRKEGKYTGRVDQISNPASIKDYFQAVSEGAVPLNFTLFVPAGYGSLEARRIPNVEETDDPGKVFTAHFDGGAEVW